MGSITKRGEVWRAQIKRKGIRLSETFRTKQQAVAWVGRKEAEILAGERGEIPDLTVTELLDRYAREVSEGKKGRRWEVVRIEALKRDRIAQVRLRQLAAPHLSAWQQRRLETVSEASVRRERNLLNHAFEVARKEWHWLSKNPLQDVRRPKDGKARSRMATEEELAKISAASSEKMGRIIVWAVETGMRAGEIAGLQDGDVVGRVAVVREAKTMAGTGREVPLSEKALSVWKGPFGIVSGSITKMWSEACKEAGVKGLTFHDLRHLAITRLARKLNPLELARMVGHNDLRMLQRYYNETAEEIAKRL